MGMNYLFSLATIYSHLVILSFPFLFHSNETSCHQIFTCPFSFAFTNLTLLGSSISSYSKYSSSSLIQLIKSTRLRFPENVGTSGLGLFPILEMALKSFSSSRFRTASNLAFSSTSSSSLLSSHIERFITLCHALFVEKFSLFH